VRISAFARALLARERQEADIGTTHLGRDEAIKYHYPDGWRIEVIDPKRITASQSGHHSIDCGVVGYFDCVKGNSLRICSSFIMVCRQLELRKRHIHSKSA
jgi:hypothetical protein